MKSLRTLTISIISQLSRHQHVGVVAHNLDISTSTVIAHVDIAEDSLGIRLFWRGVHGSPWIPTIDTLTFEAACRIADLSELFGQKVELSNPADPLTPR